MPTVRPATAALLVIVGSATFAWRDDRRTVHVPCAESGASCAQALQQTIDGVPAGTTITLDPGKLYDGTIVIKPKEGADAERPLTITTRGWIDKGAGWNGLVTPADKPRMAVLRATARENVGVSIESGGGHVALVGLAFEAVPPAGQGDIIRIGSHKETDADRLPRNITIRQVLLQGDRDHGQKRAIVAHGQDIDISQVWCEEIFIAGQDAQCIAAWNGGKRVRVRHAYLAAGAENLLIGGSPAASEHVTPEDWLIEDVILHKPLRWQQDGANRQVKNLLEFKFGKNITVRRVLGVNNWKAAQDGMALLLNYTTNGRCPQCGNLENVLIEDVVMLNVAGGISFQGYSWLRDSFSDGKLRDITIRNAYVQLTGGAGRTIQIANVLGRHDLRIERSTFINSGRSWLTGSYGSAWRDKETRVPGGPIQGLWLIDNVFVTDGRYGLTAPDGQHEGTGIGAFVAADLQIAGNVFGGAPARHIDNYNQHTGDGAKNVSASREEMLEKLPARSCGQWKAGKGADCAKLAPVFDLLNRLPES
jgi:hypothetical protein